MLRHRPSQPFDSVDCCYIDILFGYNLFTLLYAEVMSIIPDAMTSETFNLRLRKGSADSIPCHSVERSLGIFFECWGPPHRGGVRGVVLSELSKIESLVFKEVQGYHRWRCCM